MTAPAKTILSVRDLTVRIPGAAGVVHAVTSIDLDLRPGRIHAVIGESGCGKSIVAATLTGLLPRTAHTSGSARLTTTDGHDADLVTARPRTWSRIRGRHVAFVPQSAATHLTPVRTVGAQLAETCRYLRSPRSVSSHLTRVGLAPSVAALFPHELSGGMAQRVAVALALVGEPQVIVADEPTAGLDPDLAARILALLRDAADAGATVLLITHDIAGLDCDDVSVMYAGRIVEHGPGGEVLDDPWHDYTRDLIAALPAHGLRPMRGLPPEATAPADDCPYHLRNPGTRFSGGPTHLVTSGGRTVRIRVGEVLR